MKINRNNYEAYFIDYLEGNLDETLVDDFIEFLQLNPDLKKELSLFETVSAVPEEIGFHKKESLYKEKFDSESEFDKAAVAILEGDMAETEKSEFENYLTSHPEKKKDAELFQKTKLYPDESVIFSKKRTLYRHSAGKTILMWTTRIAAVLILALTVYTIANYSPKKETPVNKVAEVKKETPKSEITTGIKNKAPKQNPEQEKSNPEPVKTIAKKEIPRSEVIKKQNEKTEEVPESNNPAFIRTRETIPLEIASLSASIPVTKPEFELATMNITLPKQEKNIHEERLLADVVKEKTGIENLSLGKITKAGLSLVSSISGDKFTYQTNNEGKVTEINYDSRLVAFTIPTKNEGVTNTR